MGLSVLARCDPAWCEKGDGSTWQGLGRRRREALEYARNVVNKQNNLSRSYLDPRHIYYVILRNRTSLIIRKRTHQFSWWRSVVLHLRLLFSTYFLARKHKRTSAIRSAIFRWDSASESSYPAWSNTARIRRTQFNWRSYRFLSSSESGFGGLSR